MKIRAIGLSCLALLLCFRAMPQSISGGTITGTVKDPSGATVPGAKLVLRNGVTAYEQAIVSDNTGSFRFTNVPLNNYQLSVSASGFSAATQTITVANTVPMTSDVVLTMGEVTTSVSVESTGAMIANEPSAHSDADSMIFSKLPSFDPAAGLSSVINNSTGGTAGDANGFFHPLGDHAHPQASDGQAPAEDQGPDSHQPASQVIRGLSLDDAVSDGKEQDDPEPGEK